MIQGNFGKKLLSFFFIGILLLILFTWVEAWVIILLYIAVLLVGVIAWLVTRPRFKALFRRRRTPTIYFDDDFIQEADAAEIDKRVSQKLFVAFGEHAKWRWLCKPKGFYTHGGLGRIEMMGTPHQFADVCLKENGYLAVHTVSVQEVGTPPTTRVHPSETEDVITIEADSSEPPSESPPPVTPISNVISLLSAEGVEKWFRIAFYDALSGVVNDLNNQGSLSLTIFKDGKSYSVGSEEMVHDFGKIPDESFWELIVELLEKEGLFAEEREGTIFISWSY